MPRRNGTTPAAEAFAAPLVACTITLLAMIVARLTVPRTRTLSPFSRGVVGDASVTLTCGPAGVVRVKLDVETLATVPIVPPAAAPERAFDPPLRGACCADAPADVAVVAVFGPLPAVALDWVRG